MQTEYARGVLWYAKSVSSLTSSPIRTLPSAQEFHLINLDQFSQGSRAAVINRSPPVGFSPNPEDYVLLIFQKKFRLFTLPGLKEKAS